MSNLLLARSCGNLLTTTYSRSDLSLVYPIARGAAPVLVLVGTTLAGVALGLLQTVGVVLVGAGVLLVRETSILFAIALGACVLREPVGRGRVTSAAFVVTGVALVAVG